VDSNDYSVDPVAVGRRVEVVADLTRVTVSCAGKVMARHGRCWARHQTLTDPEHRAAALAMSSAHREHHDHHDPTGPDEQDEQVEQVEQRDLATYDAAFGLDEVA
jgi:hypothetical protein